MLRIKTYTYQMYTTVSILRHTPRPEVPLHLVVDDGGRVVGELYETSLHKLQLHSGS